jgi:phenylalanyl-tRNA synthetase beta chain
MRASLDWLKDLIDIDIPAHEAAHVLTMAGLEVEGLEEVEGDVVMEVGAAGKDYVFEVNVTPNRPDCLSLLGIARELSALTGKPIRLPEHSTEEGAPSDFSVEILDEGLCQRYAGRIIRGVRPAESPEWMKKRLEHCGIRAINNIVDITNYVLLEFGHPLHAFDLDTLRGNTIKAGKAGKGAGITTIDGVERSLPEDALLIWDTERPVAVAGVMGGADTEVTASTRDVFLESAWFRPESVRRTSKILGLQTESSYRFERGTDIENLDVALDRAVHLILKTAGGKAERKMDVYPVKFTPAAIRISSRKVNRVLGTDLATSDITGMLEKLDIRIKDATGDGFVALQPSHRPDLQIDIDIIEETARLYGYDRIPTAMPTPEMSAATVSPRHDLLQAVKETLRKEGFHDAVNYSFMNDSYLELLNLPRNDKRRNCVEVRNPLRKEDAHLRTMLLPSLLENYVHNISRGVKDIKLYEAARVFEKTKDTLPTERLSLGAIFSTSKAPSLYSDSTEGFYLIKGALESVLDALRISACSFMPGSEPYLHPGKSVDISIGKEKIGCLGVVSPEVIERLEVKSTQEVLIFEIDLEKLMPHVPRKISYKPVPRFPAVERDIAIVLDDNIKAADVIRLIEDFSAEVTEEVTVFDSYRGKNIPEGKKSLAFNIRYRLPKRTLTDEEVDGIHKGIVERLLKETSGAIREH